jgi:ABC-type uncharacterized transport system/Domain of unknown function (DUF4350)
MKKNMYWIALAALLIPILARGLWFYRGFPNQPKVSTPDYQSFTASEFPQGAPEKETEVKQIGGVVLFDYTHSNQYQPPEVQSLTDAIEKRGGQVETITDAATLESKLKYASTYTVISPSTSFSTDETRMIQAFVQRGGRLVVFTDATHGLVYSDFFSGSTSSFPDANMVNPLLAAFGITVNNDYLYNVKEHEGNFRNVFFDSFGKNELTFGLKQVALYGAHSIQAPSGLILLRGTESTLSSINDTNDASEGGAVLSKDGNVLVFGDFTFLSSPYEKALNNSTLIDNIADFSLSAKQKPSLANFPYIFSQSELQVYPSSEVQLTAETISAISTLQSSLSLMNISVKVVDEAPRDGDSIILGTFTPSDDLLHFTDPFNINFDDSSDTITLKNFGKIGRAGNGLLLLEKNKTGNTLTLLADTSEDLLSLLNTVAGGSLYGCVLQEDVGICSVGFGGSFSGDTGAEGSATSEPVDSEATPTASG